MIAPLELGERVEVSAPASLSNLGPGFDTLGLAISGVSDRVIASVTDQPGVHVSSITGTSAKLPLNPTRNTASRAATRVLERAGASIGLSLEIQKGIPLGSGIGGSAASAVAGAWAANLALGQPFSKAELVDAVLHGEEAASGSRHGDNVLPALFGGLVLTSASTPERYRELTMPAPLPLAVVVPGCSVLTSEARAILPSSVPLRDAVHNASDLAFLVHALTLGDWQAAGSFIMQDRLVEPVRAQLVPCYDAVKQAAIEARALGCALTGSGPAMFAICASPGDAERVLGVMLSASQSAGLSAIGWATEADTLGVREGAGASNEVPA
ncbi:MAG: homoserine kinase [Bacteroidota bacterium]